jgi:GT2 family glycosyltransferase
MNPSFSFRRFLPSVFWEINDLFFTIPEKVLFRSNAYFNKTGNPIEVAYISGADLMIPKVLFKNSGGFCSEYFMYFEETDLALTVKSQGYLIKSLPDAIIQHFEGASFDSDSDRIRFYLEGKLLFYHRNYRRIYRSLVDIIIRTTYISRIAIFTLIFNKPKVRFWKSMFRSSSEVNREFGKFDPEKFQSVSNSTLI